MKALIVYDSVYGNTEKIAGAMSEAITPPDEAEIVRAGQVNLSKLASIDLLIVGSPTHGGRPTPAVQEFLGKVTRPSLEGVKVAAFDTRTAAKLARVFGNAAARIAGNLEKKGGTAVGSPEGFFVKGSKGPLKEGELERAASWVKGILESTK